MFKFKHVISHNDATVKFHLHRNCEIYFAHSGVERYLVENNIYPAAFGDLFITNETEMHMPYITAGAVYERTYIQFSPTVVQAFNTPAFNLLHCLYNRPRGQHNKISLEPEQVQEVCRLFNQIERVSHMEHDEGPTLKLIYFIELLITINRAFLGQTQTKPVSRIHAKLVPVLDYIDGHLADKLTLDIMENKFYISKFYLSHLFKKNIGVGVQEYIRYKRISKAKELLSKGLTVTEVCQATGFNDYSNFIRTFKSIVGVSPGQYGKKG